MRYLYFRLLFLFLMLSPHLSVHPSSEKKESIIEEEKSSRAPSNIKKRVGVISNFEQATISPLLEFISSQTGLECRLIGQLSIPEDAATAQGEDYDLFLGTCPQRIPAKIMKRNTKALKGLDPSLYRDGILIWSRWYSCIAVHRLFSDEIELNIEKLKGKITTLDPQKDRLLWLVLYTLYDTYGKEILEDINSLIPLYRESREELIFTIESGSYPSILGIDGYFTESIKKGYPIDLVYSSFSKDKYPVITVAGENIAYIPRSAENPEGADYILDFLMGTPFQSYLAEKSFQPSRFEKQKPQNTIPVQCNLDRADEFHTQWMEIAFPEIIEEMVEKM